MKAEQTHLFKLRQSETGVQVGATGGTNHSHDNSDVILFLKAAVNHFTLPQRPPVTMDTKASLPIFYHINFLLTKGRVFIIIN